MSRSRLGLGHEGLVSIPGTDKQRRAQQDGFLHLNTLERTQSTTLNVKTTVGDQLAFRRVQDKAQIFSFP